LFEIMTNPIAQPTMRTASPANTPRRTLGGRMCDRQAATSMIATPIRKIPAVPAAPPRMSAASNGVLKF
jgi:hypothetical protein